MPDRLQHLKLLQDTGARLRKLAAGESSKLAQDLLRMATELEDDAKMVEAELIEAGFLVTRAVNSN